jgi:hypothetical protein
MAKTALFYARMCPNLNCISIMMNSLACITGFFMNFELYVIFYQNMPNLHNRYISAERKISQKNTEYMLNYSLPCSCSHNLSSFWLTLKQQWTIKISSPLFSILSLAAILVGSRDHWTQFWKGAIQESDSPALHSRWLLLLKIEISSNGQNCSILCQNVPKFELYKYNDELFNIYYRWFQRRRFKCDLLSKYT